MASRKKEFLTYLQEDFAGQYLLHEPLCLHTYYKIGGPADFFVYPRGADDLVGLLSRCRSLEIDTFLLGGGANVLASDAGFRGVIINLGHHFNSIHRQGNTVVAGAGTILNDLLLFCEKSSLGGLQCLSGIPGTVGGALIMNAGTHGGEIGETVKEVYALDQNLEPTTIPSNQISFQYRSVPQLQDKTLLGCKVKLYPEKESILREVRTSQLERRAAKQPLEYPSCGCIFKRPPKHYVGKLVEDAGLKGLRYGDAMISKKHAGFIVNIGNARAEEVLYLILKIQEEISKRYAVDLEPEVRFLGFSQRL